MKISLPCRLSLRFLGLRAAAALLAAAPAVAEAQTTRRMSVDSAGIQGSGDSSFPECDATGRRVVFESHSTNLVPGDGNFAWDIFVRDQKTGTTRRVSIDSAGNEGDSDSFHPSISDDGRIVAFDSRATNLVIDDKAGFTDVFVHDLSSGVTTRISLNTFGGEANGDSERPHISGDGRFVAFHSSASNLVNGDSNGVRDVFVHDLAVGSTVVASVGIRGQLGNGGSHSPRLNFDGRYVAYASDATNLVSGDTNGVLDVFRRDLQGGVTLRASQIGSTQGDDQSDRPDIDASGDRVVFESRANNLLAEDLNAGHDIFLHTFSADTLELISVKTDGSSVHGAAVRPSISGSGNEVAFTSYSSLLVDGDTNGQRDIFVRDRSAGTTERVSLTRFGAEAENLSDFARISTDGRAVAFHSPATNLVLNDTNLRQDVFVRGQWLWLQLEVPILYEFDPFEIYWFGGLPRGLYLLQAVAVNGQPFRFNLQLGRHDGNGLGSYRGVTPPGLRGLSVDLQMLGFADDGALHVSNVASMGFR